MVARFSGMLCIILLILSCEKSTEWDLQTSSEPALVVEAILTNELRIQEIRLSTTYVALNSPAPPVDDAMVSVSAGGTTYLFDPVPTIPGLYFSRVPFAVVGQLQYTLEIIWNEKTVGAQSVLSEVVPIPSVEFTRVDTLGNFTIDDNIIPIYHEVQQAMYQFDLYWSHIQPQGQNAARLYFYTFNTLHISEFLRPARADVVFPAGTIAVITKFGLSEDFAAYVRAVAIETDWNATWFYGNPEDQPTNLSSGALGYFATCAVLRDTMIVQ